ncbi:hypothetical protein RR42_m0463 [Cupriavidus basilensis]|uniref:Uncharacterized protein n=1 Tax=Cupriavidus basilensis TaxID=68895 RepID=A0A0C4YBA8_9BURK|nr:hypothetical protein RR42_m0463 [Cupriavidus basilensis]
MEWPGRDGCGSPGTGNSGTGRHAIVLSLKFVEEISCPRRRASLGAKRSKAGALRAFVTTDRASYRATYSTNL